MTCPDCGADLVQIITTDGVGWYHRTPDPYFVYEDCPSQ